MAGDSTAEKLPLLKALEDLDGFDFSKDFPHPTEEVVSQIKASTGKDAVALVINGCGLVIVPPSKVEWEEFRAAAKQGQADEAEKVLRWKCTAWPDVDTLNRMIARFPGIEIPWARAVAELAGSNARVQVKKF